MAKITPIYTTFSNGELTPLLEGRVDIQAYTSGAIEIENFFITPYGGLKRRPGTYYVAEVKYSAKATRLIPFQFSITQAYIIEVGNLYMRFYKVKGQILYGGAPYEIITPYLEADLFNLQFCQDADTMYIVHPSYKPQKLTRTDHTSWTIGDYAPTADPFTSTNNYPGAVAIYEQRLCFAYTATNPQTVWMTKSGDYENMTTGPEDDDAIQYTIGSNEVNAIIWLHSGKVLLMGTLGGVFSLSSGSSSEPITSTNVNCKLENPYGALRIMPKKIGSYVYYVQRNKRTVREMTYSYESEEFIAKDATLLSEHITGQGIVDMAYQQAPYNMLWCVTTDGWIALMTRQIEQEVKGWSRITTDGYFESVAIIAGEPPAAEEILM